MMVNIGHSRSWQIFRQPNSVKPHISEKLCIVGSLRHTCAIRYSFCMIRIVFKLLWISLHYSTQKAAAREYLLWSSKSLKEGEKKDHRTVLSQDWSEGAVPHVGSRWAICDVSLLLMSVALDFSQWASGGVHPELAAKCCGYATRSCDGNVRWEIKGSAFHQPMFYYPIDKRIKRYI